MLGGQGMNIGLIQVDGKLPNLALMKLAAYHKRKPADTVQFYHPLWTECDRVYASKVFTFTPEYQYYPDRTCEVVQGGPGYGATEHPHDSECPDYELFGCDYAMGYTSRGCPRSCPWCIVPDYEGDIRAVADIYQFWRGQEHIMLLDNNLTALPEHLETICGQLAKEKIKVDFCQGLDIRLLTQDMANLLKTVHYWKYLRFAWDVPAIESDVLQGIECLKRAGFNGGKLMFYVMIGFSTRPDQDLHRVEKLRDMGVNPFVMPYDRKDRYQRDFARWVNHKAIFKSVSWSEYQEAKG